jgi:GDPmannose 4,6-dehydratase
MPSAFITGVTGQDGSYLAERLHGDGWDVHALVRPSATPQEQPVPEWVSPHEGDLLDSTSLVDALMAAAPDAIFNLAGITSVALSWKEPDMTARVTAIAVSTMLDAAWNLQERERRPVRFIQASSAEMFGAATRVPQDEHTPLEPVNPYGAAKAYAHHLVGVYRARGLPASSAILYNHESPRRPIGFVTRKITLEVARIAAGLSDRLVLGNLDAERDWGWAPDYVDAMVRMAESEAGDDYVIATGESHTVREFVAAAFSVAGIHDWERFVEVDAAFLRPVDAPVLRGDSRRARAQLGWAPTTPFTGIVEAMVKSDIATLAS